MNLCEQEFNYRVFGNCEPWRTRSIEDAFTLDELLAITETEEYRYYSEGTKSWIWSAIDSYLLREGV